MSDARSRRLRLRIFPEDVRVLEETPGVTTHTSKSNMIRAALGFFEQVWSSRQGGFRVVYRRPGSEEAPALLDAAFLGTPEGGKETRPRTAGSIEIRLTRADHEKIEGLLALEAADTYSEVIRRAIRLYAAAVARCREGWEVVSQSPSGDMLPLTVPGLGAVVGRRLPVPYPEDAPGRGHKDARLSEMLPRSLVGVAEKLAGFEGCGLDVLLVDLVRTEALSRLRTIEEGGALPRIEEPILDAAEPSAALPSVNAVDEALMREIREALEPIAGGVEQAIQLIEGSAEAAAKQADLFDLMYSAEPAVPEPGAALSPSEDVIRRARQIVERTNTLVALAQRQKDLRAARAGRGVTKAGVAKSGPESPREEEAGTPSES